MDRSTQPSFAFILIRALFVFVLNIFYSTIVVEGKENIPKKGATIIVANHSNSLTDALLIVVTSRARRKFIRLTAKATQFGRGTFTSWLIENAGTLPIERPKDYTTRAADNTEVFAELIESLGRGDATTLFPEGLSRYYPSLAPMKQGVSRIAASVLELKKGDPAFTLKICPVSITYIHRNLFKSDVLVIYHPPRILNSKSNADLFSGNLQEEAIRDLTTKIGDTIRSGTYDAPNWGSIRAANTARRIYAPFGARISLATHVKVTQTFIDGFAGKKKLDMVVVDELKRDLTNYQDILYQYSIKDDRVKDPRMLLRTTLIKRLLVRAISSGFFFALALPGLVLWSPIFIFPTRAANQKKISGPAFDTYDEIVGLITGCVVYIIAVLLTGPLIPISFIFIPFFMWLSLRWIEDGIASLRATISLFRLLQLGRKDLLLLRAMRSDLRLRVVDLGIKLGLPEKNSDLLKKKGRWRPSVGYFSLRRRRKKDWNECLRLTDQTEFPLDDPNADSVLRSSAAML